MLWATWDISQTGCRSEPAPDSGAKLRAGAGGHWPPESWGLAFGGCPRLDLRAVKMSGWRVVAGKCAAAVLGAGEMGWWLTVRELAARLALPVRVGRVLWAVRSVSGHSRPNVGCGSGSAS